MLKLNPHIKQDMTSLTEDVSNNCASSDPMRVSAEAMLLCMNMFTNCVAKLLAQPTSDVHCKSAM